MVVHGAFLFALSLLTRGDKSLSGKVLEVHLCSEIFTLKVEVAVVIVVKVVFGCVERIAVGGCA